MPQLDFNFYCAQIFWLLVSFGLLFVAMKFWLLPPLIEIIHKREEKIKHILRQADKLSAQAQRIEKEYQHYVDESTSYCVRVLQTARDEIEDDKEKLEKDLLAELKTDTQNAQKDLAEEKKAVYSKLEVITYNFIQIFLKVCYAIKPNATLLKKEVSVRMKGDENV